MEAITQNQTDRILDEVQTIPIIQGSSSKIFSMLNDPEVTISQIEENLRYDPSLTTNILKIANSSYYGFSNKISSIHQAIVLLGIKTVTQIITASCINTVFNKPIPGYDLSPGDLWMHSIGVAVTSEELMKILKLNNSGMVFTAALLHDIGKLILGNHIDEAIDDIENNTLNGMTFEASVRTRLSLSPCSSMGIVKSP